MAIGTSSLGGELVQPCQGSFPGIDSATVPQDGDVVRGRGRRVAERFGQLLGGQDRLCCHGFRLPLRPGPEGEAAKRLPAAVSGRSEDGSRSAGLVPSDSPLPNSGPREYRRAGVRR